MSALATSDVSRRIALVDARTHFEGELTTVSRLSDNRIYSIQVD